MTKKIKVAIFGIGNCCSSLFQGLNYYFNDSEKCSSLLFQDIGGYSINDIEVVAAFDVDLRKIGKPLSEAIFSRPNNARIFQETFHKETGNPIVQRFELLDGVSDHIKAYSETDENVDRKILISKEETHFNIIEDTIQTIIDSGADIIINYLPVGSQEATEMIARIAIKSNCAFLNCIPVFIASDLEWEKKFVDARLPLIGDDMRSQFGASVVSQILQELAFDRGMKVKFHQQINLGGNLDFQNMLNQDRLKSKKISKENVIRSQNDIRGIEADKDSIFAGPSSYIPYLGDNKIAHFRLEMEGFGGAPVEFDAKLKVCDSENSSGVVIDAIRFLKVARELNIVGSLRGASAITQKTPPKQSMFQEAKKECEILTRRERPTDYYAEGDFTNRYYIHLDYFNWAIGQ